MNDVVGEFIAGRVIVPDARSESSRFGSTPSPALGEGEPGWQSCSRFGRGLKADGIKEKGEGS
jgi:hypothetical protein